MNQKSASSLDQNIFQEQKLSFAEVAGQSKLFVDYQKESEKLNQFYPTKNIELSNFAQEVLENYQVDRNALCDILAVENENYNAGEKTYENIEQLRKNDCVAVLTGQQAGLFSGPLYTFYKAFSAIKLADDLTRQGIKAVPIFWIASEDHDFDEISKTFIIDSENVLHKSSNTPRDLNESSPIGFVEIDESISKSIDELFSALPKTEFTDKIKNLLVETYKAGETFSSAFGKLLARVFKEYGLIFVSPLNRGLRKLCSPIYVNAIENSKVIGEELLKRNEQLEERKYHSQVLVEKNFFPFFYIDKENKRNSLRFNDDFSKIVSEDGTHQYTTQNLVEIANNSPERLSPNALMRPIVQDYIFPTICYFGGGAEIAYFGQNSVIYNILNRPNTPIRHRSSFTIIQGKHRRTLDKYNLAFGDLFDGSESVLAEIIEKYLNPEDSNLLVESEEEIEKQLSILDRHLSKDNPTLANNLSNRRKKILWHIEALRKKFHRAEILRNKVVNRQIEGLFETVLPNGHLQERTLNILTFLNLYGENFIEWIYNVVDSDETSHQIIIF